MPSDRPEIYLRKILANGARPFVYRSGIRALLGLPENADLRLAYSLVLPLPGFNYLRRPYFNEGGLETPPMSGEASLLEFRAPEPAQKAQFRKTSEPAAGPAAGPAAEVETRSAGPVRRTGSASAHQPDTSKADAPKAGVRSSVEPQKLTNVEKLQIDIPGFSEKKLLFPALTPRTIEETPGPETPAQAASIQHRKERQPQSSPIAATSDIPNKSGVRDASVAGPPPPPFRKPAERMSANPIAPFKFAGRRHSLDREIAERPAKQAGDGNGVSTQPGQQRAAEVQAEAQIEQLRQRLSVFNRKTVSHSQDDRDKPQAEPSTLNSRPESALPPPVAIATRTIVQRQAPAAFWERSHLTHFFRLRRLR